MKKSDPLFSRSYKIHDEVVYLNDLDGGLLLLHLQSGISFKAEGLIAFILPHLKPGIRAADALELFKKGFVKDAAFVKDAKKTLHLLLREKFIEVAPMGAQS